MMMENRKRQAVSDSLAYRDEYSQHLLNIEVDPAGDKPLYITVTLKSADLDKVERAMKRIKEFIETEFRNGT